MIKAVWRWLKRRLGLRAKPKAKPPPSALGYSEEEARKVKERLQGLGYLD